MIGIDLIYLPEFKKQLETGGQLFLDKVYDKSELNNVSIEHLAGLWAAKEAVIKASNQKITKLNEITISFNNLGKPSACLNQKKFEISISHHHLYAVAIALAIN
jgi:phosphopantetheine--protein transferase-like protein